MEGGAGGPGAKEGAISGGVEVQDHPIMAAETEVPRRKVSSSRRHRAQVLEHLRTRRAQALHYDDIGHVRGALTSLFPLPWSNLGGQVGGRGAVGSSDS